MSTSSISSVRVYMDANATTPLLPEVVDAMRPYWMEHFGNASSIHLDGQTGADGSGSGAGDAGGVFQLP